MQPQSTHYNSKKPLPSFMRKRVAGGKVRGQRMGYLIRLTAQAQRVSRKHAAAWNPSAIEIASGDGAGLHSSKRFTALEATCSGGVRQRFYCRRSSVRDMFARNAAETSRKEKKISHPLSSSGNPSPHSLPANPKARIPPGFRAKSTCPVFYWYSATLIHFSSSSFSASLCFVSCAAATIGIQVCTYWIAMSAFLQNRRRYWSAIFG